MTACTEKEAAEKWCPHVRGDYAQVGDVALNKGNKEGRCIGSRCMQWRWFDIDESNEAFGDNPRGYCGLAGNP
jgi:hypothetical protein